MNFWADWCVPSLTLAPIVADVAEDYEDKIKVYMLNIDQNPNTLGKYVGRGVPTLMIFKNAQPVDIVNGVVPRTPLDITVEKHLP